MKKFAIILISALAFQLLNAQGNFPKVNKADEKEYLLYPWAGGMNSCQFGEIDLNMDGIKDLFVFDRHGNRIMTFLNQGIADSSSYIFAPEYASFFPELYDWAILIDYDQDGKQDIFTYSRGFAGVLVYRNVSKPAQLEFQRMVYPFLTSLQGNIYTNILVTYVDYPGIVDLDEDGDLDILTFWGLGSFIEVHQNMSIEKYGIPDSLDYKKVQYCWGNFAESDESNQLYLDTCIGGKTYIKNDRHTGSTLFIHDLNADDSKDLVLGDVDYPDLVLLTNAGTSMDAHMESQDWDFPSKSQKVKLFSMPAMAYIDINNDQKNEMLVSPFDPGLFVSENHSSVWLYENSGEENNPDFQLSTRRFLQEEMIDLGSGAYPAFFDYNQDGLQDLVVGNYGYYDSSWYDQWLSLHSSFTSKLALFENTGTAEEPAFEPMDYDYLNLSELQTQALFPAFGDMDGDGDMDLLLGNAAGTLYYYKNIAANTDTAEFIQMDDFYQQIDVGEYSAPVIYDLNRDGLPDLIIGERKGNLNYYRNTGSTQQASFELVTDSLGKINVTDISFSNNGFSKPHFFSHQNETKLIVGSEQGKLFYFENIDGNLEGKFTESDSLPYLIDEGAMQLKAGMRTSAAIADLNNDSWFDLIAGNFSGGLRYFSKDTVEVSPSINELQMASSVRLYPNPASAYTVLDVDHGIEVEEVCIYHVYGSLFDCLNPTQQQTIIDLSVIPAGVYVVRILIKTDSGQTIRTAHKLIVK